MRETKKRIGAEYTMKNLQVRNSLLLILTALIWGTAFVAQSEGGDAVGPYSFNCIRSIIGGLVLLPVIKVLDAAGRSERRPRDAESRKRLLVGGVSCGTVMFFASSAQQLGLTMGSPAGKAGFLTACYILLVPVLGLFLGKKCGWNIWVGIVIAVCGLYLLCMTGSLGFASCDIMLMACAFLFACHILVIDHFSPLVDGVRMACIQFFTAGLLSAIPMFWIDMEHSAAGFAGWLSAFSSVDAWVAILYAGVLSSGVGYTLQIVAQNGLNPTVASMLMSLESVFSVLAGWVILKEALTARQLAGCALIFSAVILAQAPVKKTRRIHSQVE